MLGLSCIRSEEVTPSTAVTVLIDKAGQHCPRDQYIRFRRWGTGTHSGDSIVSDFDPRALNKISGQNTQFRLNQGHT